MTKLQSDSTRFYIGINIFVIFLVSIIFLIPIITKQLEYNNYNLYKCNVETIKSPTSLIINAYWGKCKCGKRCFSWNSVIRIYGYIINTSNFTVSNFINKKIYMFQENNDKTLTFTFFDRTCREAYDNNIKHMEQVLHKSQNIFNTYYNKTIDCYYNSNLDRIIMFKNNVIDSPFSIFYYVVISFLMICCLCQLCCNQKKKL